MNLAAEGPYRFRIEPSGAMRVPGVVFASEALLRDGDKAVEQVANVATLPGVVDASYAMPDVHWGYGFAIWKITSSTDDGGGFACTVRGRPGLSRPGIPICPPTFAMPVSRC